MSEKEISTAIAGFQQPERSESGSEIGLNGGSGHRPPSFAMASGDGGAEDQRD